MARKKSPASSTGMSVRASGEANLWDNVAYAELFGAGYRGASRFNLFRLAVSLICIDVKSQDVAKTPIYLRRWVKGGSKIVSPAEHPVARMLAGRPNRYFGMKEWLRIATAHLVTAGQYYAGVQRTAGGDLVQMQGVPHTKVSRRINVAKGRYVHDVLIGTDHERVQWGWMVKDGGLFERDIAHIRLRSMNGYDAIGNDMVGTAAFQLVSNMADFQSGIYQNGGVPALAFTFPSGMTDQQYTRLKKDLDTAAKRLINDGKPLVLEGADGAVPKVEKLSQSASDTEFMKAQTQAMLDVLRVHRVPPHKAFVFESVKYDNLDSMERLYVDDSLVPIFDAIEEALTPVILTEEEQGEYFIQFDREAAYAMDPTARQKIVESKWKSGMISQNEMREAIGENRLPDGNVFMISGNFVLINDKNEPILMSGGNKPGDEKDHEQDEKPEPKKMLRVVS